MLVIAGAAGHGGGTRRRIQLTGTLGLRALGCAPWVGTACAAPGVAAFPGVSGCGTGVPSGALPLLRLNSIACDGVMSGRQSSRNSSRSRPNCGASASGGRSP